MYLKYYIVNVKGYISVGGVSYVAFEIWYLINEMSICIKLTDIVEII